MRHMTIPTPDAIRDARITAGLTQTEAGQLVHVLQRAWARWEAGDREMHPGLWELFQIKTSAAIASNT